MRYIVVIIMFMGGACSFTQNIDPTLQTGSTDTWVLAVTAEERQGVKLQNGVVAYCDNGDWLAFDIALDGHKALGFEIEYSVPEQYAGQAMELHLDSPEGKIIGKVRFESSGSWEIFKSHSVRITPLTGTHKLYMVFRGSSGVCNLKRFRFLGYAPELVISNQQSSEAAFLQADNVWLKQGAKAAAPLYSSILNNLSKKNKSLRSLIIMRKAQAQLAAKDDDGCQETLSLLDDMEYVPEHHALAAKEMRAVIARLPHPGQKRTPIPKTGKAKATIHVNSTASLDGDGSEEKPLKSLRQAVFLARKYRKRKGDGAIEIVLAPGTFNMTENVALSADDSGTEEAPLVIRSRDPRRPATLTGGIVLKNWDKVTDRAILKRLPKDVQHKVVVCNLRAHGIKDIGELVFGGFSSQRALRGNHRFQTFPVPELFYRGEPQVMARWPNNKLTRIPVNEVPEEKDSRFENWSLETDLWLYGYWQKDWADAYEKVVSIEANGKINVAPPYNCYGFGRRQGCAVNALCEIDSPGEWHLDTKQNLIYYLPSEKFDPDKCILSSFDTPISAKDCSFLQIRDLNISYIRGDALIFENCDSLLISGIDISNCSGLGLKVHGGKKHLIHSCRITSMGRGAIDILAGNWRKLEPASSIIENCSISNLSRIDRTYTPAVLLEGMGIKVRHNSFVDIPSSAIRVETCDAIIELNYFRNCVYESGDQGAIDMWANPLYRGNIIRWNDFDRIINNHAHYGAAAIRHDDYISGFMVYGNVFRKSANHGFGAVQFNQGADNYVEGNLIIDWHKAFTGRSITGNHWKKSIARHRLSKKILAEVPWQSEAWQKKYPMLKSLLDGDDNHNYLLDNLRLGAGKWGGVSRAISFANQCDDQKLNYTDLKSLKSLLKPWHQIPLELIGTYK